MIIPGFKFKSIAKKNIFNYQLKLSMSKKIAISPSLIEPQFLSS